MRRIIRRAADVTVELACVIAAVNRGIAPAVLEDGHYRPATDDEWADMAIKRAKVLRGKMGL